MFDLKDIRDNPEAYKTAWNRKASGLGDETVPEILRLDEDLRAVVGRKQEAEQARNANSKLIGKAKGQGDEAEAQRLMAVVAEAKATIESAGEEEAKVQSDLNAILMGTPNVPMPDVPEGEDEAGNVEQHKWGDPDARLKGRNRIQDHADLGAALKNNLGQPLMDFEAAAAMSGARFVALRGDLARLERALASFMLDQQTQQNGYEEVSPPLLVRDNALEGTGQLPKFEEDLFSGLFGLSVINDYTEIKISLYQYVYSASQSIRNVEGKITHQSILAVMKRVLVEDYVPSQFIQNKEFKTSFTRLARRHLTGFLDYDIDLAAEEFQRRLAFTVNDRASTKDEINDKLWLAPTAEVPLTNLVREQILTTDQLPMRMTAHTPCFRSEAGSAGRDTKGMIRLHQFNKVEMVSMVRDEEEGLAELERMTKCAEGILEALGLAYRRMLLCTGDMGFGARKTYDLEVWLPSQNTYREISSCSYCGDFQARRMKARWRPEPSDETPKPKPEFVHTLNGSGLAVGRTLVAVLENYQNEDGSIEVPEVLRPYMGGQEVIS